MGFKKICSVCKRVIDQDTECKCRVNQIAESNKQYDKYTRDKKAHAIYESKPWRVIRKVIKVRDNGLCQRCLDLKVTSPIEYIHHIVEVRSNYSLVYDLNNLIGLCSKCHGEVHSAYDRSDSEKKRTQIHLKGLIEHNH